MTAKGKYGFDLHGLLDTSPETGHLTRALHRMGSEVYIITASDAPKHEIEAKLNGLKIYFDKVIKVTGDTPEEIGAEKGKIANHLGLAVYFDNDQKVLTGFAGTSQIARCQVLTSEQLQPKVEPTPKPPARSVCRCELELRDFQPRRCMHCPEFLESAALRAAHSKTHHD